MEANEALFEQQVDTQHGRYLAFDLDEEVFGLEIQFVTEIIGMQTITKIPEVAEYIMGIINLRGKIIPVIDMRLKFGMKAVAYDARTCIIVIDTQDMIVGLIVDKVSEVLSIDDQDIVPPPDQKTGIQNRYIQGIGTVDGNVKLLLDCKMLFEEKEVIGEIE